jgi:hypothetical protein
MRIVITTLSWLFMTAAAVAAAEQTDVTVVRELAGTARSSLYTGNRAPLVASQLVKLPIGAIRPQGWLRHQLELERDGMIGHLTEISPWCKLADSSWGSPQGVGKNGWEELPYWLKGYANLGYVLKDEAIIRKARPWIEAMLASRQADGWFGPRNLKGNDRDNADFWPHMLALNVLQSYYEYSGDPRVIECLTAFFRFQLKYPEKRFLSSWAATRKGDNLESVYWLYNRTGEPWLLELAAKIHRSGENWVAHLGNGHGVNISQAFREPGIFYLQDGRRKMLDAAEWNYQAVMGTYGQFPGGGFAADENFRPGYTDPHQGFETCSWVELMHSFEMLTEISGNPLWADRCEEVAFNSYPASMTPDQKGIHYLTCANVVQLDKHNKAPGLQNGGNMFGYSPFECFRCCQHNISHGWPYYAEELWLATADGGLCASLYAASTVTAKVGDGAAVTIAETTDYPFSDTIELKLSASKAVRFPLYLRVPRWCHGAAMNINGEAVAADAGPLSYVRLERTWNPGDTISLRLPMSVAVRTWPKNKNSVSVDYGPVTFSLKIGEKWVRYGDSKQWPLWEVFPTTPWNYGLVLDEKAPASSVQVVRRPGPLAAQPFVPDAAPIELKVQARKIPNWTLDSNGLVAALQPSPVRSDEPLETVTLIPMGAARLRLTAFPRIDSSPDAHEWKEAVDRRVSASHCNEGDSIGAVSGLVTPARSSDPNVPRFTWWGHLGTSEWIQYDFVRPARLSAVEVYWFDDSPSGGCRVPASWRLVYKDGGKWKPVPGASTYGTKPNQYNRTTFPAIQTKALRLEAQLRPNYSAGIFQWKAE